MTRRVSSRLVAFVLALPFALQVPATASATASEAWIETSFALLSGRGGPGEGTNGAVVVPGTVFSLESEPAGVGDLEYPQRIAGLTDKIQRALSLGEVEVLYTFPTRTTVGEETELPPPSATSAIRVTVELQGYNESRATYEVRIGEGREVYAESVVSIERGKQAVVGGLDGEEAPYLFLVVSPSASRDREKGPRFVVGDVVPPRRIEGPAPQYTPVARTARIQGVVIVQALIGVDGRIHELKVLKGLPMGLSEAAAEAIREWRFEPARDESGNPVDVYYNLTVNFRLADEEEDAAAEEWDMAKPDASPSERAGGADEGDSE